MSDPRPVTTRCSACGAELPSEGAPCGVCFPANAPVAEEDAPVSLEEENDATAGAFWPRVVVASIYAVVGALCVYGSFSFFARDPGTISDWIFGSFGLGMAVIALIGIKEAMFPSDWSPD